MQPTNAITLRRNVRDHRHIEEESGYNLLNHQMKLPTYRFNETCQDTTPAIIAFGKQRPPEDVLLEMPSPWWRQ